MVVVQAPLLLVFPGFLGWARYRGRGASSRSTASRTSKIMGHFAGGFSSSHALVIVSSLPHGTGTSASGRG